MDDEQAVLDLLSRMLTRLGYEVIACAEGRQAIAAYTQAKSESKPFDAVIMDLVICNGMGGEEAILEIKKIDPKARVIATSGHLKHPVMLDHKAFNFDAAVEKPYKLDKLKQVIESVISTPAA
jgi:DNA-binding NtrC family response regulator